MKKAHQNKQNKHQPVLLDAVLKYLDPQPGESYLDVTAGYGGHAKAVMSRTLKPSIVTLVDRDSEAIKYLQSEFAEQGIEIIKKNYLAASEELLKTGKKFNLILADLGVSSPHLNEASRGFSFKFDGPLDMRMDQEQSLMASEVVNDYSESQLAQIIEEYGEDPKARKIARLIKANRPIQGTEQLASIIKKAWPGYSKVHPATRTFQAIRIVVNDELGQLKQSLPVWVELLEPGGRIVVISFHSLEDRIIKHFFGDLAGERYDAVLKLLNKRPVEADRQEVVSNPRARSAKLRAAVKINKKGGVVYAYSGKEPLPGI